MESTSLKSAKFIFYDGEDIKYFRLVESKIIKFDDWEIFQKITKITNLDKIKIENNFRENSKLAHIGNLLTEIVFLQNSKMTNLEKFLKNI